MVLENVVAVVLVNVVVGGGAYSLVEQIGSKCPPSCLPNSAVNVTCLLYSRQQIPGFTTPLDPTSNSWPMTRPRVADAASHAHKSGML